MPKNMVVRATGLASLAFIVALLAGCGAYDMPKRTYQGVVLDAVTLKPIEGITVQGLYSWSDSLDPVDRSDFGYGAKQDVVTARTDREGRFKLKVRGMDPMIDVDDPRYLRWRRSVERWPQEREVLIRLQPLGVRAPQ